MNEMLNYIWKGMDVLEADMKSISKKLSRQKRTNAEMVFFAFAATSSIYILAKELDKQKTKVKSLEERIEALEVESC